MTIAAQAKDLVKNFYNCRDDRHTADRDRMLQSLKDQLRAKILDYALKGQTEYSTPLYSLLTEDHSPYGKWFVKPFKKWLKSEGLKFSLKSDHYFQDFYVLTVWW